MPTYERARRRGFQAARRWKSDGRHEGSDLMFGHRMFGASFFGPRYFGPAEAVGGGGPYRRSNYKRRMAILHDEEG